MNTTGTGIEHDIGSTGLLVVNVRSGDIRLRAVEGSTARVDGAGGDLARSVQVERGEGSLSLRAGRAGAFDDGSRRRSRSTELVIDVPTGATVVIEGASAEVTVDGLTGDQRYRTASGDIRLRDVSGRLAIETLSGDVDILAVGTCSLAARTVSGDLSARAADLESVRGTTTSGDVRLAGRLTGSGPYSVDTVSGDILLALAGSLRLEAKTVAGDVTSELVGRTEGKPGRRVLVIGEGGPTMTVRSMSGDVALMNPIAVPRPAAPVVPAPPVAPVPPRPSMPSAQGETVVPSDENPTTVVDRGERSDDDASLTILRALERGEIDVAEAARQLEALDAPSTAEDPSDD